MELDFRRAGSEIAKKTFEPRSRHRARPGEAKNPIRRPQSGAPCAARQQPRPGCDVLQRSPAGFHFCEDAMRLARYAQAAHVIAGADWDDLGRDRRMQVKVLVSVDVVE